jgi:hypothetical protein
MVSVAPEYCLQKLVSLNMFYFRFEIYAVPYRIKAVLPIKIIFCVAGSFSYRGHRRHKGIDRPATGVRQIWFLSGMFTYIPPRGPGPLANCVYSMGSRCVLYALYFGELWRGEGREV